MDNAFKNELPDWHGPEAAATTLDRHHNQPPLEERVIMDFEDQLRGDGLLERIAAIIESASRAPAVTDQAVAGKVGDLIAMGRAARKAVEERRETHNRPLLNAQRALKGRADAIVGPMDIALNGVKRSLDNFMAEEARKAAEERRRAEEAARIAREAAERAQREAAEAGKPVEDIPLPVVEPAKVEQPVARGDMGARVGTRTVWSHEVEVPIAKLPKAILENEKVKAAVDQIIAAMIRGGTREIKGVRIWSDQVADVR